MGSEPKNYRSRLAESRLKRVLAALESLPMLPTALHVPLRLMELHRSPKPQGLDAFAEVLIADAALSSKVLELANSAWFSRSRSITRVTDALKIIGLNNLLPLIFGLSLAGLFNKTNLSPQTRSALWRTSLLKGVVAREWLRGRAAPELFEVAFLCAVMQDLAVPIMLAGDPSASLELAVAVDLPEPARLEREQGLFATDHAALGKLIAGRMQLPELYLRAIATHHAPNGPDLPAEFAALQESLQLAAMVPHNITRLDDRSPQRLAQALVAAGRHDGSPQVAKFIDQLTARGREILSMLAPSDSGETSVKEFLQEVSGVISRTLFSAIGASNRTIEQLQEAQAELESRVSELDNQVVRAEYDPLTNALGRRGFYTRGQKLMDLARKLNMACAVGFVDMDQFKRINDEHGHDAGDAALVCVTEALAKMIQSRGILGRCGGDEFGFVIVVPPETGRELICKEVATVLESLTVTIAGVEMRLRASAGIAWLGVPDESQSLDSALKLADQQMYQSKRARPPLDRAA